MKKHKTNREIAGNNANAPLTKDKPNFDEDTFESPVTEHAKTDKEETKSAKTPIEDLRKHALDHYEELSEECHHWLSTIPKAINFYFDDQIQSSQLAAKKLLKGDLKSI